MRSTEEDVPSSGELSCGSRVLVLFSASPASVSRLGASVCLQLYRSSLGVPCPVHSVPLWYGNGSGVRGRRARAKKRASFHVVDLSNDMTWRQMIGVGGRRVVLARGELVMFCAVRSEAPLALGAWKGGDEWSERVRSGAK